MDSLLLLSICAVSKTGHTSSSSNRLPESAHAAGTRCDTEVDGILSRAPRAGVACQALAELTHPEGQTKISDSPHCEKKIRHAPKFVCRSAKDLLSTKGSAPVRESPSEECRVVRVFFGRCRCSGSYCQGTHQQRRSDRRHACERLFPCDCPLCGRPATIAAAISTAEHGLSSSSAGVDAVARTARARTSNAAATVAGRA